MKRTLLHILCIFTLGLALLAGCNKAAAPAAETHSTTGVVVEVRPNVLVIQHQDFPGFMKGMTMPFELADPDLAKGIKKLGEHNYELQRGTLESVLGNMNLLSRSARIVPEMKDGKAAGFRLFAVRPDGPFAMIGMQNGDIISSINGLEITSPEKALEVYAKLKSASHLSLGMERNGQKVTKEYNIR